MSRTHRIPAVQNEKLSSKINESKKHFKCANIIKDQRQRENSESITGMGE